MSDLKLHNQTVLAPLAGWTDSIFRRVCKKHGAALVFSEMVSADGLLHNPEKTLEYVYFKPEERPIGIQVFGSEADVIAGSVRKITAYNPDLIDINCGCPVKKVIKRGAGSAILEDLNKLAKIARAAVDATHIPITAKIRSGWNKNNAKEIALTLEQAGISAISVHPRTRNMLFKGKADWEIIRDVKTVVKIPVIGNGDIRTAYDAKAMLDETGCDLVMIGRGALGNPWIFEQTNQYLNTGKHPRSVALTEVIDQCIDHLYQMIQEKGEKQGLVMMRKHVMSYLKGFPNVSALRKELFEEKSFIGIKRLLQQYSKLEFEKNVLMNEQ